MHRLLILPLSLLLLAAGGLTAAAAEHDHDHDHDHEDSPLMEEMETINRAFKTIRRNISKPEQCAEVLAAIDLMRKHATAAKAHQPPVIATLPKAEQAAAEQDYGERMDQVVAHLTALKAAVEAKDEAKAASLIDALREAKKTGHEKYVPDE